MTHRLIALALCMDLAGLSLGLVFLFSPWRKDRFLWLRDLTIIAFVSLVLFLLSTQCHHIVRGGGFARLFLWAHILFYVAAILLLIRGFHHLLKGRKALGVFMLLCGILGQGAYQYAQHIEPFQLQVNPHVLITDRVKRPIKILVFADLQAEEIGAHEKKAFDLMDQEKADLILCPGDFIQVWEHEDYHREREKLTALFKGLKHKPSLGIYSVQGDVDSSESALKNTRIPVLVNESMTLDGLQVIGLSRTSSRKPISEAHLEKIRQFDGFSIVLGHSPDFAASVINGSIEKPVLCVAGHTHGGQVAIPGIGPLLTFSRLDKKYASGFHQKNNSWILVSRGVGLERLAAPRIRFCCPPELVVLELKPLNGN